MDEKSLYTARLANYSLLAAYILRALGDARDFPVAGRRGHVISPRDVARLRSLEELLETSKDTVAPIVAYREAHVLPDQSRPVVFGKSDLTDLKLLDLVRTLRSEANHYVRDPTYSVESRDPRELFDWIEDSTRALARLRKALDDGGWESLDAQTQETLECKLEPFLLAMADHQAESSQDESYVLRV